MKLLSDVDGDEISIVRRAANKRRFLLLKGDEDLDTELSDILSVPWEREGALLDEIRKDGVTDETVEKAVLMAVRLLKGVESEFSPELIEKLGTEMYGASNPKLNTSGGTGGGGQMAGSSGGGKKDGSGSGASKDGSGSDGQLSGTGSGAKVAGDPDGTDNEPDDDEDDSPKKKGFVRRAKSALSGVGKAADDSSDDEDVDNTTDEGGTVGIPVPVRKEDGTWDLSGVPDESRPFFEEMIQKADKTESDLKEAREQLAKSDDTLRTREMLAKAAGFSHVAPTDDLAPILKEASEKFDAETFEKLSELLTAAEERITKGDLFSEMGKHSGVGDAPKSDAWSEAVKKADEMVEKADKPLSQDQALARVWESNPDLYSKYLSESGMGVSY